MIEILLFLTAVVCLATMAAAWFQYHDPLHPLIMLCPLLVAAYVWTPYQASRDEEVLALIPVERFPVVLSANLLFVSAFLFGCLWQSRGKGAERPMLSFSLLFEVVRRQHLGSLLAFMRQERHRVGWIVILATAYSQLGYWTTILNAGGFVTAYNHAKGGGFASSGYVGEAMLLSCPALLLFATTCYGRRLTFVDILIGLAIMAPELIQGTFGGRRGPLFLALMTLALGWFLARGRRPSWFGLGVALLLIALAVAFVGSQRSFVYLGSEESIQMDRFTSSLTQERSSKGGTFPTAAGSILTCIETEKYSWGKRSLVTYLVRPIPRQLFADKKSVYDWSEADGVSERDMKNVMGWMPESGFATGFVADLFMEFSWLGAIAAFFYGAIPGFVWRRAGTDGGIWLVLLGIALILSIYVPTQSVSAFLQRFLFMSILTWIAWQRILGKSWARWLETSASEPNGDDSAEVAPPAG